MKALADKGSATPQPSVETTLLTVNVNEYLDQSLKMSAALMTFEEVRVARERDRLIVGDEPLDGTKPTVEQLSTLRALLRAGRNPYADFAVWNCYGPRASKFRKVDAQIFIAGVLTSKRIEGPGTFDAWWSAWGFFSLAMISLGQCRARTTQRYRHGIKRLNTLFPNSWG